MNKTRFISVLLETILLSSFISTKAYAAPKGMSDGQLFDAQFYADTYQDVKAAYGYNEEKLYTHYLVFGKAEGRKPYANAAATTAPQTNDLTIDNKDETAEKQAAIQAGYYALPQNVKTYYNKKNIKIYAATREYIGTVNTRQSLGYSYITWDDNDNFISADVYVCGTISSFMPPVYTLYHELGHVLDYGHRYSKNWDGWTEMQPYSPTQVYSASEAFAEAFAAYFAKPEKLKAVAPIAYTYIENIIVNMQ